MNTIFWKGVLSTTIEGLLISELPPISKPPLRVKETTIDGRDGSIIEELGYSSYDKTITIGLRGNFNVNKVIKYFTGEGEIIFSNEPDKVYTAKIVDQIDYNRLLRFRTAVVKFRVQPFKHKYLETYKEAPTESVTGTSIVVTNKEDSILKSFIIYGKTTQDGTPTPDAPVDLVSVGAGGSIAVSVTDGEGNTQTMVVQTPNGLCGIPVSSGGNYTDANGQQWICDEIDLTRGVYVQRVGTKTISINDVGKPENVYKSIQYYQFTKPPNYTDYGVANDSSIMCDRAVYSNANAIWDTIDNIGKILNRASYYYIWIGFPLGTTLAEAKAVLNGAVILYGLAIPKETPLTEEEIATYQMMKTNELPTISNDANANMKVEYFKPFEVFNEGLEDSKPIMVLRGSGTVGISVNGIHIFDYTFPDGENEVVIDSEKEDAYLGDVLKNRNMNGEFPTLLVGTNKIEWSGDVESIEILPRSRWL